MDYTQMAQEILRLSLIHIFCVAVLLYPAVKKMLSSRSAGNGRAGKSENQSK